MYDSDIQFPADGKCFVCSGNRINAFYVMNSAYNEGTFRSQQDWVQTDFTLCFSDYTFDVGPLYSTQQCILGSTSVFCHDTVSDH